MKRGRSGPGRGATPWGRRAPSEDRPLRPVARAALAAFLLLTVATWALAQPAGTPPSTGPHPSTPESPPQQKPEATQAAPGTAAEATNPPAQRETPPTPPPPSEDYSQRRIGSGVPGASSEGTPSDTDGKGFSVLDMLWPLALVIAGIFVLAWAVRRLLPGMRRISGGGAVEVLARTYVAPRQSINVVKLGRRILVVGQSADQLSPLASITDPEEVSELMGLCRSASPGSSTSSFRKIFERFDRDFDRGEPSTGGDVPADTEADASLSRIRSELDDLRQKVRRAAGRRDDES